MSTSRFRVSGLFAVLLALMAQLGSGAAVPRFDPVTVAGVLCHADDGDNAPAHGPSHPIDCLLCPLCAVVHAPMVALTSDPLVLAAPTDVVVARTELPPPSTAPPAPQRSPSQPRAPPPFS